MDHSNPTPAFTQLGERLLALELSGLIRRAPSQPEVEYFFRHALVQEATYSTLVKRDRKQLHLTVGETLERTFPERLDTLAPLLAHHFYEADERERALRYFARAGAVAASRYANAEALMHYARALELAKAVQSDGAPALEDIYLKLGRLLELSGQYEQAFAHYTQMEADAQQRGDRAQLLASLLARATVLSTPTPLANLHEAEALCGRAIALARELNDRAAEAKVLWNLMLANYFNARTEQARTHGEQALAIARALDLRELLPYTLNDLGRVYLSLGYLSRALAGHSEAQQLWRASGNLEMVADSLNGMAEVNLLDAHYPQALEAAHEAYQFGVQTGNKWGQSYSLWMSSYAYFELGQWDRALHDAERAIALADSVGFIPVQINGRADLGMTYAQLGQIDEGLALARTGLARMPPNIDFIRFWLLAVLARIQLRHGDVAAAAALMKDLPPTLDGLDFSQFAPAMIALAASELALARGMPADALQRSEDALRFLQKFNMRYFYAEMMLMQGRAHLASGDLTTAETVLEAARVEAEEVCSRRVLWQILAALSERHARGGDHAEAERQRAAARTVLQEILARFTHPTLRTTFLQLPAVRAVLDA